MNPQTFLHSGDMGDIIYGLPTIKELGGGILFLDPTWDILSFNEEKVALLKPLLVAQPYIDDVIIQNEIHATHNLNKFRLRNLNVFNDVGHNNLASSHLEAFGLSADLINEQWLIAGEKKVANIIFHRSSRYHNEDFPWKDIVQKFQDQAIFVGLEGEHEQFVKLFGDVPFYQVYDCLELAEIINAADLFIGNQSMPFAISEGLHKKNCLEICRESPNCNFKRDGHNIEAMNYARAK